MQAKPELPWRRREQHAKAKSDKAWWKLVWASRPAWTVVGGAAVFVLTHGVESLSNIRKLPSEAIQTFHSFQSWYYDDDLWTGTWSSREEGDVHDYRQADAPLKLAVGTERGRVSGEMFNKSVCEQNPLLPPVLVEGEISRGRLLAYAFAYVGGEKQYLYSFQAKRSAGEPVIVIAPIKDPSGMLPSAARLVHRPEDISAGSAQKASEFAEHPDLMCPESGVEYLLRLRREGKMGGILQEPTAPAARERVPIEAAIAPRITEGDDKASK